MYVVRELEKKSKEPIVILKTPQCKVKFDHNPARIILSYVPSHFLQWVRSIYHLATSTTIFVDNYFGFLAAAHFRSNVNCIQLWHATGAIKKFGLKDPSIKHRSKRAIKRFKKVYENFDYVIVGSDKMSEIFQQSFGISEQQILHTGIPRTDYFFQLKEVTETTNQLYHDYPIVQGKKVILYAPTFRKNELIEANMPLNLSKMYRTLKDEYVLLLRLHPSIRKKLPQQFPDFICDVSEYPFINHVLVITDILVTDYSSISFEFSLLGKPIIFFAYDLEEYSNISGLWNPYEETVPGPIVTNTDELLHVIKTGSFNMEEISKFRNVWNKYSIGRSSERLIRTIYG